MPTMIEKVAEAILEAYTNHEYTIKEISITKNMYQLCLSKNVILEGTSEQCTARMEEECALLYARAAIEAMKQPDGAMLWVRSKGYDAMIEAALK